jgi:hypothetical protein
MRSRADGKPPGVTDDLPPYFGINPNQRRRGSGTALGTAGFRTSPRPAHAGGSLWGAGSTRRAPRLRRFSTWEITRYLIPVAPPISAACCARTPTCPRADRNRGRREMVHPRRGPAAARPFRGRRVEGQGLPPLPARGAARQDRGGGELQGRGGQDLDRGASGDVGGARRLPGAGGRSRQPGLDDLDLRGAHRR